MRKLLVPVDFSPHTTPACHFALNLAAKTDAEIILFHSFFDQLYFSDGGFSTSFESGVMLTDEIILDFYKQKEARLNEIAGELSSFISGKGEKNVKISCHMESGDPEVQIMNTVQLFNPDMIIMGSGGMGKKSLLAGSMARRIIEHIDLPVIAVPDTYVIRTPKNVAYMTTFKPEDCLAIKLIDDILAPFNVNIFCVHLLEDNNEHDTKEKFKGIAEEPSLKSLGDRLSCHISGQTSDPEGLRSFLDKFEIDLITFIPQKRNFLKNLFYQGLTKEDLFLTHLPIMAVKPS